MTTFSADDLDESNARQIEKHDRTGCRAIRDLARSIRYPYEQSCPTCDAPEPAHSPRCAVVNVRVPEPGLSEAPNV